MLEKTINLREGVFQFHFVLRHLVIFCLGQGMICKIVSVNAPWDLSPNFFRLRLSYAPHTSELYRRTGANKESNKKLHLDIESFFSSMYLLQANTERLDFSTKFFLEVAKLPFELNIVPR